MIRRYIRSITELTPEDDDELTDYLWPIVREIIKITLITENYEDSIKDILD